MNISVPFYLKSVSGTDVKYYLTGFFCLSRDHRAGFLFPFIDMIDMNRFPNIFSLAFFS